MFIKLWEPIFSCKNVRRLTKAGTFQGETSDEQDEQHTVWEQSSEVHNLKLMMGKKLPFLKVVRGHTQYWKSDANFRSQ